MFWKLSNFGQYIIFSKSLGGPIRLAVQWIPNKIFWVAKRIMAHCKIIKDSVFFVISLDWAWFITTSMWIVRQWRPADSRSIRSALRITEFGQWRSLSTLDFWSWKTCTHFLISHTTKILSQCTPFNPLILSLEIYPIVVFQICGGTQAFFMEVCIFVNFHRNFFFAIWLNM